MPIKSSYLTAVFDLPRRRKIISDLVNCIKLSGIEFEAIAFRGMSGALIVPDVSTQLDKPFILIRKEDSSHSSHKFEGELAITTYIIIDDCISSGQTVMDIMDSMGEQIPSSDCKGVFLYAHSDEDGETNVIESLVPVFCL